MLIGIALGAGFGFSLRQAVTADWPADRFVYIATAFLFGAATLSHFRVF